MTTAMNVMNHGIYWLTERPSPVDIRRYFKTFPHFFDCRVLVSVRLLRVGSIVHHILIV